MKPERIGLYPAQGIERKYRRLEFAEQTPGRGIGAESPVFWADAQKMRPRIPAFLPAVFCAILAVLILLGCTGSPEVMEPDPEITGVAEMLLSPEAEELVRTGILYHDRGDYETALDYYGKAMELSPEHPVIYYEMGFSYMYMGNFEKSLEMADKGIYNAEKRKMNDLMPNLLDLKGSTLDNLGQFEESLEIYRVILENYTANPFVYYNMSQAYYHLDRYAEAQEALVKGLGLNPNHASSNFFLGRICLEENKKTQGFFPLVYFLLLEPNTFRSEAVYDALQNMLINTTEEIGFKDNGTFTAADLIISLSFALDGENAGKSDAEKFNAKLYYIFTALEEQKNNGKIERTKGDELWWDFYSPFFYRIAQSNHFGTFCRYIGITSDPDAEDWIENGRDEIDGFFEWLNEYDGGEDSPEE